jgi:penicillin V acylase-like amidase (Ntn superfamily)
MNARNFKSRIGVIAIIAAAFTALIATPAQACTRALYVGDGNLVITGRSMDWAEDMHTNLWVFPRGIARDGEAGPQSPKWTSRYGSIIASGYDIGSTDGMNEAGLVANLLYLAESDYGKPDARPAMSISLWAQYVLDNFRTVDEAVAALSKDSFRVVGVATPNGMAAQLHLSISDATGDSAIFEYIGGKLVVHHGRQYTVMTNSPSFDQQLAINAYWNNIGGANFLPGTYQAPDRFARASYLIKSIPTKVTPAYISALPGQKFDYQAAASVLGVMRNVGVPLGIQNPAKPNLSATLWRTVADQKNLIYYFDSATSPNTFWVPLADLDFKSGAPVKKLTVAGGKVYAGNVADKFVTTPSFKFLPAPVD